MLPIPTSCNRSCSFSEEGKTVNINPNALYTLQPLVFQGQHKHMKKQEGRVEELSGYFGRGLWLGLQLTECPKCLLTHS